MMIMADGKTLRLIKDPPGAGSWNMSVDQAMLALADEVGTLSLRFYQWQEPTLSLGYFQKAADREGHAASQNCPLVRRASGGGAILHDKELTYSLCIPSKSRWSKENEMMYTMVHQGIVEMLSSRGTNAGLYEAGQEPTGDKKAFLCFQRRTSGDIVLQGHKVVGSAQRRLKNAVLQHGSILINASEHAPELHGLNDLSDHKIEAGELAKEIADYIAAKLELEVNELCLDKTEILAAEKIESEKFGNQEWTFNR